MICCVAIGPMIMMKFACLTTKKLEHPDHCQHEPDHGRRYRYVRRLSCYAVGDEVKFACVDGPEFDGHLIDFDHGYEETAMYKTEEGQALLKLQ